MFEFDPKASLAFHAGHGLADFLAWNLGGDDSLGPWAAVVVFVPGSVFPGTKRACTESSIWIHLPYQMQRLAARPVFSTCRAI